MVINLSSISKDKFALVILSKSFLIVIKVSASLWDISIDIISAPLRAPPWDILAVVVLNISINGTIPSDLYSVPIGVPLGLNFDNDNPWPPCDL